MIPEELKLDGDVAILVGQKKGSLAEFASVLAEAGASVMVAGPRREALDDAVEEVLKSGRKAFSMVINPASSQDVQKMVTQTLSVFGRIDILVNAASVGFGRPIGEVTDSEWQQVMDVNLTSVFVCSRVVGAHMRSQKSGRIVNIISGLAERGLPNGTAYCASMGGVSQLSRALGLEWARDNVRVNSIGAGWMEDAQEKGSGDLLARYVPLGRLCRPEDISPLLLFLASPASSYMTAYTFYVDGGLMARG